MLQLGLTQRRISWPEIIFIGVWWMFSAFAGIYVSIVYLTKAKMDLDSGKQARHASEDYERLDDQNDSGEENHIYDKKRFGKKAVKAVK